MNNAKDVSLAFTSDIENIKNQLQALKNHSQSLFWGIRDLEIKFNKIYERHDDIIDTKFGRMLREDYRRGEKT